MILNDLSGIVLYSFRVARFKWVRRELLEEINLEASEDPWAEEEEADENGRPITVSIKPFFISNTN